MNKMFDHYTEDAKRTIFFAKREAAQLGSTEIAPEHIFLGLLTDEGLRTRFMRSMSVSENRERILAHVIRRNDLLLPVDLPLSSRSREVLAFAREEAEGFGHLYIANSHILLGCLRIRDSYISDMLMARGLSADDVRFRIADTPSLKQPNEPVELVTPTVVQKTSVAADDVIRATISKVEELRRRGEQRSAMKVLDDLMAEQVPDRSIRIRNFAPLATAIARSIGRFDLVEGYCRLRLADDPGDIMALYGMAECIVRQGDIDTAKMYATKCYELGLRRGDAHGKEFVDMLMKRFPEMKFGS